MVEQRHTRGLRETGAQPVLCRPAARHGHRGYQPRRQRVGQYPLLRHDGRHARGVHEIHPFGGVFTVQP